MLPREFLHAVPDALRSALPPADRDFLWSTRFSIAQFWYESKEIHYEVGIRSKLKLAEIGLHFESDPITNDLLLQAFSRNKRIISKALGPSVLIEKWDKGWARVWEPLPFLTLDEETMDMVIARVVAYMKVLNPILDREMPAVPSGIFS